MGHKLFHKNTGEIIYLNNTISFGRTQGDLTFPDDDVVSSRHGKFILEKGIPYFQDTGSTNGSFINKNEAPKNENIELHEGDTIQAGEQIFIYTSIEIKDDANIEEEIRQRKAKTLLEKVKKNKEGKVGELEKKLADTQAAYQKYAKDLEQIQDKIKLANNAISELSNKISQIEASVQHMETNKDQIKKDYEEKKKPLYDQEATLIDKIRLMDTTGAPDEEKIPMREELIKVREKIKYWDEEKKAIPLKVEQGKISIETGKNKLNEYSAQKQKLLEAERERRSKYAPEMERLEEEISTLSNQLQRAKEELARGQSS